MARDGRRNGERDAALRRIAEGDPELAVRLIVQALPAAAAELRPPLSFGLDIDGVGSWIVEATDEGPARVRDVDGSIPGFTLHGDPSSLARVAAGANPLPLLLSRRLRISGRRRKALALRRLSGDAGPRELARLGLAVDPDLAYRALAHAIDPEWTRGHRFSVAYELTGDGGGRWVARVDDGSVRVDRDGGALAPARARTPRFASRRRRGGGSCAATSPRRGRCSFSSRGSRER